MSTTTRRLAVLTGVMFAATAAIDIPHRQPDPLSTTTDYMLEGCFAIALAAAAVTLLLMLRSTAGLGARVGWALGAAGHALVAASATATFVRGGDSLDVLIPIGLLTIAVAYLVLLVQDLRRHVDPRGVGIILLVATVAMVVAGEGFGLVAWSAGWFGVAALLQRETARVDSVAKERVLPA